MLVLASTFAQKREPDLHAERILGRLHHRSRLASTLWLASCKTPRVIGVRLFRMLRVPSDGSAVESGERFVSTADGWMWRAIPKEVIQ